MATTYGKDYVDFDMDFTKHPSHGDLSTVKKSTAISRSIKNLLSTNANERLFQPTVDSGIGILLFENFSKLTSSRLEKTIRHTIEKYEPRAKIANITVKAKEEENAYEVIIVYLPDNDIQEASLEVYLQRT
ncbi:MAG: GPW/gp25 family protein [Candidatus Pacebacteria bacterium]|jgi:phage baseplate assembly protein W|nr:GPW/gp25 family protein [Candidatus Paceibacterota bacterium]